VGEASLAPTGWPDPATALIFWVFTSVVMGGLSTVFEVNSSTRLTKDELASLFDTAVAAEDREAGGQSQP
jgi:hypothetical protein